MKQKHIAIIISCSAVALLVCVVCAVLGVNVLLTNFIDSTNIVCKDQKFSSVDEAMQAMESSERETNDTSLDYCPPYKVVHTFDYEKNTIVFYSYCHSYDGEKSTTYAVSILKHNDDGTLSFDSGFADFCMCEPNENEDYYYFTNIKTSKGNKSISFLYLDKDSEKNIYVDGIKAEKIFASIDGHEFYICYAISSRDTFLSNVFTPISERHKIEIK